MADTNVIHTVPGLAESAGGPSRSVVGLVNNLSLNHEFDITLLTQRFNNEPMIMPKPEFLDFQVIPSRTVLQAKLAVGFAHQLRKTLDDKRNGIVHSHGIWEGASFWAGLLARRYGYPFVLHPRGMLEPWCLEYKMIKKKLGLTLYQYKALKSVDLFFATSELELESIRALGFQQPVAVIPNGVALPKVYDKVPVIKKRGLRQALFLSRIHPKKGLLNLVRAWANTESRDWQLVIAGPDSENHWADVKKEIYALGLEPNIEYVGSVEGKEKDHLFRESELFILPSYSENFGIVVAEALAYGLPVLTTTGTPWSGLIERQCGWCVEPTEQEIGNALNIALSLSPGELGFMKTACRTYAEEFDWGQIARQTEDVYFWLLGKGSQPECIV